MRLLSCQDAPSFVKSKTSALFSADPQQPPAMIAMLLPSCNGLLNMVQACQYLLYTIDCTCNGSLFRLLELNFRTVAVLTPVLPPVSN